MEQVARDVGERRNGAAVLVAEGPREAVSLPVHGRAGLVMGGVGRAGVVGDFWVCQGSALPGVGGEGCWSQGWLGLRWQC